jgi:FixJ family two-component response regulator
MMLAVVDDDADVRTALNRLLRTLGHEVRLFTSAEEFAADRPEVDCLILDIRLPGLTGVEMRERMHGHLPPIIFITGEGDRFFDEAAPLEAPMLHKPFDEDSLIAAINHAVDAAYQRHH